MRQATSSNGLLRSEITAYACVASAAIFVLALTFGVFDGSGDGRRVASNAIMQDVVATP